MTKDKILRKIDEKGAQVQRWFRLSLLIGAVFGIPLGIWLGDLTQQGLGWRLLWVLLGLAIMDFTFHFRVVRDYVPRWTWWGWVPALSWFAGAGVLGWTEIVWQPHFLGFLLMCGWTGVGMFVAQRRTMRFLQQLESGETQAAG